MGLDYKQTLTQMLDCIERTHIVSDEQSLQAMLWVTLAIKSMIKGADANGDTHAEPQP